MAAVSLLDIKRLEVVYEDALIAVQGVSLQVPQGSIVALLGANAAGKTTTLRAISGFLSVENARITDGTIDFNGECLNNLPPHEISRKGIALVPEREKVFATLTVEENLLVPNSSGRAGGAMTPAEIYGYFPVLGERRQLTAGYLSGGERQMLAIAAALLNLPKLLLVDELSLGLAPRIMDTLIRALRSFRENLGGSILLVDQNAVTALEIADYAYIMENGRIVYEGTPERLLGHEDVKEFYLGIYGQGIKSYREVKQYRRTRRWWG